MKRFLTCAVAVMMLCSLIFAAAGCGSNNAVTLTLVKMCIRDRNILSCFKNEKNLLISAGFFVVHL